MHFKSEWLRPIWHFFRAIIDYCLFLFGRWCEKELQILCAVEYQKQSTAINTYNETNATHKPISMVYNTHTRDTNAICVSFIVFNHLIGCR